MIKELHIKNFESHKNTVLHFSPGVNTLIGNSDAGKSSIIRAIYFLAFNKPGGTSFISDWADETEIIGIFDDCTVSRLKGDENIYKLNNRKLALDAGRKVPKQVTEALGLYRYNFSLQGDPHFMLSWSPSERATYLNDITNLKIIDRANSNIKSTISGERNTIKTNKVLIKEYKQELKEYENLEDIETELKKIESMSKLNDDIETELNNLTYIVEELEKLEEEIKQIGVTNTKSIQKEIKQMSTLQDNLDSLEKEINEFENLIEELEELEAKIKQTKQEKEKLQTIYKKLWPDICPLCNK